MRVVGSGRNIPLRWSITIQRENGQLRRCQASDGVLCFLAGFRNEVAMMIRMMLMTITCLVPLCAGCDEGSYNANSDPLGNDDGEKEVLGPQGRDSAELPELPSLSDGERAESEQSQSAAD